MADLKTILESIRIRFAEHEIWTWGTSFREIDRDSEKIFPAFINYEIIGAFIYNEKINVIVLIKEYSLSNEIISGAMKELRQEVIDKVKQRIPETNNKIEVIFEFKQRILNLPN